MNKSTVIAVCQNCKCNFELTEIQFKNRKARNRILCKTCDYKFRQLNIKETNKLKYGCECVLSVQKIREKAKKTCMQKYGTPYYSLFGSEEYNKTIQEKYGVDNVAKLDWVVEKREKTLEKKTGFRHALQVFERV